MNKIEKMKRNQRIKEMFFKSLHIISYILASLFIIIAIVSGVKGCSNKQTNESQQINQLTPNNALKVKNNLNENESISYSFKSRYIYMTSDEWQTTTRASGFDTLGGSSLGYYWLYMNIDGTIFDIDFPNGHQVKTLLFRFQSFDTDLFNLGSSYPIFLERIVFGDGSSDWVSTICELTSDITNLDVGEFPIEYTTIESFILDIDSIQFNNLETIFNFFFVKNVTTDFVFANQINFYSIFNWTIYSGVVPSEIFNNISAIPNVHVSTFTVNFLPNNVTRIGSLFWDVPSFVSNGQLFNRIYYNYILSTDFYYPSQVGTTSTGAVFKSTGGESYYNLCYYYYNPFLQTGTITYNDLTIVNTRDTFTTSQGNAGFLNSSSWVIGNYRQLTFLTEVPKTTQDLLVGFNSLYSQLYYSQFGNDSDYSVFGLLSSAFVSLRGFWDIYILPGITIGVLFFMPFVVGLIVIIFRMVKR